MSERGAAGRAEDDLLTAGLACSLAAMCSTALIPGLVLLGFQVERYPDGYTGLHWLLTSLRVAVPLAVLSELAALVLGVRGLIVRRPWAWWYAAFHAAFIITVLLCAGAVLRLG